MSLSYESSTEGLFISDWRLNLQTLMHFPCNNLKVFKRNFYEFCARDRLVVMLISLRAGPPINLGSNPGNSKSIFLFSQTCKPDLILTHSYNSNGNSFLSKGKTFDHHLVSPLTSGDILPFLPYAVMARMWIKLFFYEVSKPKNIISLSNRLIYF